jgi:putative transposase
MKYDPAKHHRRSIRLKGYDYSAEGAYFITICTQHRACILGEIIDGMMQPTPAGRMLAHWWLELNQKFSAIQTDEFIVMPNHFHGILTIHQSVGVDLRVYPLQNVTLPSPPTDMNGGVGDDSPTLEEGEHVGSPLRGDGVPVGRMVQWFKTMTTNEYIRGVKQQGWEPFDKRLWQRNYYEHIIRDQSALQYIRRYVRNNPKSWQTDQLHPDNPSKW